MLPEFTDSCHYHPGEPIFHDAKKKWSCCNKYSTDFSEFLSIKGCAVGKHNSVPPDNTVKEKKSDLPTKPIPTPTVISKPVVSQRPSSTEPTRDLPIEVASNLKSALEELSLDPSFKPLQNSTIENNNKVLMLIKFTDNLDYLTTRSCHIYLHDSNIPKNKAMTPSFSMLGSPSIGTNCKNTACKQVYTGTDSDSGLCLYHSGVAVFHEGLKYWTCCNQKTSDFEAFLKQIGCTTGHHNWTVEDAKSTNATLTLQPNTNCRFDWYQFGGCVTLDIYAKNIWPETVSIKSIDPKQSVVKLMPLKAEIILKKAEPISWPTLECKLLDNNKANMNNNEETIENNLK
ncbi:unnamed protein product [Schistosoma margrebowiei]|uniref:CHORD domain-containing protein n=1 Tax=Schistosoma margrebowiei TaxID=48269 RepID=A0A3P7WKJ6_9TREM|nr:unnamed protein product [Schistosoma margrebowiei]